MRTISGRVSIKGTMRRKRMGIHTRFFSLLFVIGVKEKADVKERGKESGRNQKAASCHQSFSCRNCQRGASESDQEGEGE